MAAKFVLASRSLCVLLVLLPLSAKASMEQEVEAFDQHFAGLSGWLLSVYDVETGGFWESVEEKEKWFDDPKEKRSRKARLGRGLGYALHSLEMLGAEPLYPIPSSEQTKTSPDLAHLKDRQSIRTWFYKVGAEKNPWAAGGVIQDQYTLIRTMPEFRQKELLDELFKLFQSTQSADGYWWEGEPYYRLSGAYKISSYYKGLHRPMPRATEIYQSSLKVMRNEPANHACFVRNSLYLLDAIRPQIEQQMTGQELSDIVSITIKNTARLKRADGGFAQRPEEAWSKSDGISQAMKARDQLRSFTGLAEKPFAGGDELIAGLKKAIGVAN